MFIQGFEKTAFVAPAIQKARGLVARGTKAVGKAVGGVIESQKAKGIAAYRSAKTGLQRKAPGSALASQRINKLKGAGSLPAPKGMVAGMESKAKSDVAARAKRMAETKAGNKPSFARKHPFLTAGALYLGTKAALGGGDNSQSQQPQYVGPQQ